MVYHIRLAITWTNIDYSSVTSSGNHLRLISQQTHRPSMTKIILKILFKSPGDKVLTNADTDPR